LIDFPFGIGIGMAFGFMVGYAGGSVVAVKLVFISKLNFHSTLGYTACA
jgi:uncharacterized membrane protein (Fun14 family)